MPNDRGTAAPGRNAAKQAADASRRNEAQRSRGLARKRADDERTERRSEIGKVDEPARGDGARDAPG